MAKDYQAECEKLRGQLQEVMRERDYLREWRREYEGRNERMRDNFKALLLDVLGR